MKIEFRKLDQRIGNEFKAPAYGTQGSAAFDLVACLDAPLELPPGKSELIGTGIAFHINDPQYAAMILPRSGLGAKEGVVVGNLVGLIDSDYTGQLKVSVWNRNHDKSVRINPGDRVAQLVVVPVIQIEPVWVDSFSENSDRGANGFGSTGKQ